MRHGYYVTNNARLSNCCHVFIYL